jgi:hypothetical protein
MEFKIIKKRMCYSRNPVKSTNRIVLLTVRGWQADHREVQHKTCTKVQDLQWCKICNKRQNITLIISLFLIDLFSDASCGPGSE